MKSETLIGSAIVLALVGFFAYEVLSKNEALANPRNAGSFMAGTNEVDVCHYDGRYAQGYSFSQGTNEIYSTFEEGRGGFTVRDKNVRFNNPKGPYSITEAPRVVSLVPSEGQQF
jgi:hypothetical protein